MNNELSLNDVDFKEMYLLYYQILQLNYKLLYNFTFSKTPLGSETTQKSFLE
jgi:hypothetical protein